MRGRAILIMAVLVGAVWLGGVAAGAQSSLPQLETIEVTEPLHASLVLLQEQWLDWLTAYHQRDAETATRVLSEIISTMRDLGVERLSDLSFGAIVSAVQAARASDFERAAWALEAAEVLDPRRPEIAFAAATIARLEGRRLAAIGSQLAGYYRLLGFPWERSIFAHDVLLWVLLALILSSAFFVALLASTKGPAFFRDLVELLSKKLPLPAARVAALVLMVFPLLLPNGLLWLLVYWTIVFWGYSSYSERLVLVGVWLLLGVVPETVSEQRRHMSVLISSPMRVMQNLALSRLEGTTLTDLGDMRLLLPESMAVKHLLADVHQRVGQWEFARALYLDVIDAEPDNAEAMLNLGAFYFHVGDYASAIQLFQRASARDSVAAAAYFNLSQSYSASYLFEQSEQALRTARRLDDDAVSEWVRRAESERVVTVPGGVWRSDEIVAQIRAAREPSGIRTGFGGRLVTSGSMRLALLVVIVALVVHALARRVGFHQTRPLGAATPSDKRDSREPLAETLLPGLAEARREEGHRAFVSLLLPVALLTLPLIAIFGYRLPWGYEPGSGMVWAIAGLGLLVYFSARVLRGLRA